MKAIIKLLFAIALFYTAAPLLAHADPLTQGVVLTVAGAAITGYMLPASYFNTGTLSAGVNVEVWKKYIIEKLRKNNDFLFRSKDDSRYVLGGAVVHIPQAGADPVIEINSTTYPGVEVRRADTDITYALDTYRTVPHHIPWEELQTIAYDKIDSILGSHTNSLAEAVADNMLIKWSPTVAGKQIATTGGPAAGTVAGVGGQTGTRKGFHPKDLIKAMIALNIANVPKKGRVAVIDDNMYEFFYDQLTDSQLNAYNQFANNETGIVGKLHSFDIYTRSSVLAYAAASATAKAYGAAIAATDNYASLCYHPDMVNRAVGEMKPFQDKDNPLYYGDIYSMILRMGGRKEREDDNGVIAIVQAA